MQKMCILMLTYKCNLNCIYCYQKYKTARDMKLETAKAIVNKEVLSACERKDKEGLRFDMFGGEPLLRFSLIKELCMWIWDTIKDVKIDIFITTNGTLLDDDKKTWLEQHKEKINLIMSVDGKDDVQESNRGCHSTDLPVRWALDTMPNCFLSMTVSRKSLAKFADELIYFHEKGYRIEAKPAQGEDWQVGDGKLYEAQLERIADYYLSHPDVTPIYLFKEVSYVHLLNNEPNEKYGKTCGIIKEIVAYDVDGNMFPCHHFMPNVNGRNDILEYLKTVDFSDDSLFADAECMQCDILKICRTCCARNLNERGDLSKRDKRACQIILAENKVVSSYKIRKYMNKKEKLMPQEALDLKAAIKCYRICQDFEEVFYRKN